MNTLIGLVVLSAVVVLGLLIGYLANKSKRMANVIGWTAVVFIGTCVLIFILCIAESIGRDLMGGS